jgi:predicted amidohydrolase YtcJ
MHVAVNWVLSERLGQAGEPACARPFLPAQAITVEDAIGAFTSGVDWVNHEEHAAGTLLPGRRADVAVLDQDLYAIPSGAIGDTSVVLTVASGNVVFGDL